MSYNKYLCARVGSVLKRINFFYKMKLKIYICEKLQKNDRLKENTT